MATPNSRPNADSGSRRLAAFLSQSRKQTTQSVEQPKKDWWDRADIVAKWLIALVTAIAAGIISVVVATIGGNIQQAVTTQTGKIQESIAIQTTGKDYVQLALNILAKKDLPDEMQKNKGLRQWAVELLNHYSEVKLTDSTAEQLINGDTKIPVLSSSDRQGTIDWSELFNKQGPNFLNSTTTKSRNGDFEAAVNLFGTVTITSRSHSTTPRYIHTSIYLPNGIFASPDEAHLISYNDQAFALLNAIPKNNIFDLVSPFALHKEVKPPNGIADIKFSDDSKSIIVLGTDNREIRYDLDGNQLQ